jgi:hypothetical protein
MQRVRYHRLTSGRFSVVQIKTVRLSVPFKE